MNNQEIVLRRLNNQQIASPTFQTAVDLVRWMGAMQAQDLPMVKWAVGVRLPDATQQLVETALNKGDILRTHLLRPTWHLVATDDIWWLLELSAPQIKTSLGSRHRELELSDETVNRGLAVIEKALSDRQNLTRNQLIAELERANVATDANRGYHMLVLAELEGLICSGVPAGKQNTYTLLAERVPKRSSLNREEALAKLAKRYFTSHGPAALPDFVWWSGLSVGDARRGLEMVQSDLVSETIDSETYWFSDQTFTPPSGQALVYLLPAFDEFIISYRDRSAALPHENFNKVVSNNGIFRPMIVVDGQVVGIWKRAIKKKQVVVEASLFVGVDDHTRNLIEEAAGQFGEFLQKEADVNFSFPSA